MGHGILLFARHFGHGREIVLEAVKLDGYDLGYVAEELRGDLSIVLEAVKQNGRALQFVSEKIRTDIVVARKAEVT